MGLRIVQVMSSLHVGGGETFTVALCEELIARGHDLRLVVLRQHGELVDRLSSRLAARTTIIGKQHRYDATVWPKVLARWATWQPEVIHTHLFMALSWAGTAGRVTGIPAWVHTQHSMMQDAEAWAPWVRRALYLGVDRLVACSDAVAQDLVDRSYGLPWRRVTIPNGIPLRGRPMAAPSAEGPLRLIAVGRMVPVKGHALLLDAVAQLRNEGVDVVLELCGDGELMPEMKAQVRSLGIEDAVTFPGSVDDIPWRLSHSDLFVMPSLSEGLPISSLEAAAAGLPLLVTTGGGAGTLIEAGAGGLVVDKGSVQALVDGVRTLAGRDLAALGRASRRLVVEDYSIEAAASAYEALYEDILRKR